MSNTIKQKRSTLIRLILSTYFVLLASSSLAQSNQDTVQLDNTDGSGLVAKLAPSTSTNPEADFKRARNACKTSCTTPFGTLLGEVDGVKGYSNCRSTCFVPKFSFLDLETKEIKIDEKNPDSEKFHYIGVIHQCVEYARKWWMVNNGVTFGSIDSAFEIIYLEEGKNIYNDKTFPLARSVNGSAQKAPKRGDLIIYAADRSRPNWRHGHVAVVVAVDLPNGSVSIAEENYNNQAWDDPLKFSRKLLIEKTKSGFQITDVDKHQANSDELGKISGWIYPL